MPTGAKLIGAIIFCLTGALAAWMSIPGLPDDRDPGYLVPIAAVCGAWFGWRLIGTRVGSSFRTACVLGVRTVALMIFGTLFVIAAEEAYQRSIKLRYDGPIEALTDIANLMLFFGAMGVQVSVITVLSLGILVGATFVRWAGQAFE